MKKYFFPKMYQENIYQIPYAQLKKQGIQCLIFDFDNTLVPSTKKEWNENLMTLMESLEEKEFIVLILSNNFKRRFTEFQKECHVRIITSAYKPLTFKYKKIMKEYHLKAEQMAMIGDQMMTDMLGANQLGIYTILVDPLEKCDLKVTSVNRKLEKVIKKKYQFEEGKYYGKM